MPRWFLLTDDEIQDLNPPDDVDERDDWLPVGFIPRPHTRLAWFAYHVAHGIAMKYPLHKVLGYAFFNTKPEVIECHR